MGWRSILVKDGEYIKLNLDNMVVFKDDFEYKIALNDISIVVLEGLQTTVTTRLLNAFSRYNISLVICDDKHIPSGIYLPYNQHSRATKLLQKQISWDDNVKGYIWKKIVEYKIDNQKKVLKLLNKSSDSISKLENYQNDLLDYDSTNREGHAAKVYFNALFGNEFSRQNDDIAINAGLNYGYSIIRAHLARLIVAYGLQPILGIFHKSEYNSFNLVDDLIEPFRPFVDIWVYNNMLEDKFLTFEHRTELINILNMRAKYKNGVYTLSAIMEKYVTDFIQFMETGDLNRLDNPELESFEGRGIEV